MDNVSEITRWFADKGDYTHNLNYYLNENSIVIDLGGYKGIWVEQMLKKYNCNFYIIEPLSEYYNLMVNKFKNNSNVYLLNVGISTENKKGIIYTNGDGSSSNTDNGKPIEVNFNTIESIFEIWNLKKIDLIQINIEGDEYPLLEQMIATGMIFKFKNIQISF